jgi:hypothetical protein
MRIVVGAYCRCAHMLISSHPPLAVDLYDTRSGLGTNPPPHNLVNASFRRAYHKFLTENWFEEEDLGQVLIPDPRSEKALRYHDPVGNVYSVLKKAVDVRSIPPPVAPIGPEPSVHDCRSKLSDRALDIRPLWRANHDNPTRYAAAERS